METIKGNNSNNTYSSKFKRVNDVNKLINQESNRLVTWSLSIIGGTILTIISSSYIKPSGYVLYSYFLFAIGWTCLGVSIYFGERVTRIMIAGVLLTKSDKAMLRHVGYNVNKNFTHQIKWFIVGIVPFAAWLMVFLIWFILHKDFI